MSILREIVLMWALVSLSLCYEINYLPIGIEVYGVNLKDDLSAQVKIFFLKIIPNITLYEIFKNGK